ncbi:MAG: hypothetical protein JSW51_09305 [Gemmatimonadota bacterium]|nr:MAG: hypothetical protein JSW51_09305 [Gemmatimonadota bacterium]
MNRTITALALTMVACTAVLTAQTVPDESQAAAIEPGFRRNPAFRIDPFNNMRIPHWGFVLQGGGTAENNAINVSDFGALLFLSGEDSLRVVDGLDALGLVPMGSGLNGNGEVGASLYVGGPIGRSLQLALTAAGRSYGGLRLDDNAVSLLRDGNGSREAFSLGDSNGEGLASGEVGIHALYRIGPIGSIDGVRLILGGGARYIKPVLYVSANSLLNNGGVILVTGDSVAANMRVETLQTAGATDGTVKLNDGGGIAGDFMARVEWPTSGLALEAQLLNVGAVSIAQVEHRIAHVDINTTSLEEVADVLDTLELELQDTVEVTVTLPRLARFTASAWANRILQLDLIATIPFGGEFAYPATVDAWSTWRLIRTVPLRAGLVFGGDQGIGFSGGLGVELRNFLFELSGRTLGGLFENATGASAGFSLGVFF